MKHHYFRDPNGRELALVTIVPLSRILVGELLDSEKPQQFLDKLEAVLKTSGAKSAIFCLDISTHESKARDFRPHYKVHAHGFMFRDEFECAENALRAAFPNKGNVKRSVHHEVYDGNPRAIRYMLEIPKERSIQLKAPLKTRHWKVSNRLRSAQEVELLQWLDQIGLSSRMLVFGPGTEVLQNLWTKPQQKVTRN